MLGALKNCFGAIMGHKVRMNYTVNGGEKKAENNVPFLCKPQSSLIKARYNHVP